ncbi:hypothetical protein OPT61_g2733 [Boeremia exigua]|uniref:Uncharacterized protein n=1 Tax=Boeremia exigua TaxID=749465 RepID=A0ACC2IKK3_9PLEO|nr:hypothetical protein OPT61_g2733 [Boeremia exigua]
MSSLSEQAEPHRIISGEAEADHGYCYVIATSYVVSDSTDLEHVGAHFSLGSRTESFPTYPDGVEVSEDEAAIAQPGVNTPDTVYAYQHSHVGGPQQGSPSTPMRNTTQDSCITPDDFKELQRQRSGKHRQGRHYTRSQKSRTSTPTQTNKTCPSSVTSYSEYGSPATATPPRSYNPNPQTSSSFSQGHTPSQCSVETEEEEIYKEGQGPSPPHPYSHWDPYVSQYRFGNVQAYGEMRQRQGHD